MASGAGWGARDAAGARRIERVWNRMGARLGPGPGAWSGSHYIETARIWFHLAMILGRPPPGEEWLAWLESDAGSTGAVFQAERRLLAALARLTAGGPSKARKAAEQALKDLEALAEKESGGDRFKRDEILAGTLPAVRQLRGAPEAAKRKRSGRRSRAAVCDGRGALRVGQLLPCGSRASGRL